MEDGRPDLLSSEEAGAFVAQWAETNPIGLEDLVRRLEIDPAQVESLWRQAQGRRSMNKWLTERKEPVRRAAVPWQLSALIVVAILAVLGDILFGHRQSEPVVTATGSQMRSGFLSSSPTGLLGGGPRGDVVAGPGASGPRPMPTKPLSRGTDFVALPMSGAVPAPKSGMRPVSVFPPPRYPSNMRGKSNAGDGRALVNETKRVRSMQVIIPDDLVLSISTPKATYACFGQRKQNALASQQLHQDDVTKPLQALMSVILEFELLPNLPDMPGSSQFASVNITIGVVHYSATIHWSKADRGTLSTQFASPGDTFTTGVVVPFLEGIHRAGVGLFGGGFSTGAQSR